MGYSIEQIEQAFFNYDDDGCDTSEEDMLFRQKCVNWKEFKAYLEAHLEEPPVAEKR